MKSTLKQFLEEFDKLITRTNISTGKLEERWFVKEDVTAKEVKELFTSKLKELSEILRPEHDMDLSPHCGCSNKNYDHNVKEFFKE
jgi:hypothetical protein